MRQHLRQFFFLFCCLWGVFFCSGFVAIVGNRWKNRRRLETFRHAAASGLYDGGDRIYPTDTLQNVGLNLTQSLVPDIAYYYLQNTIGLSEETMWKITLEAGSVLGMTPRNLEKKISLLRRTMNLSDEDVRIMLAKQPAILHYSAERNLGSTIIFLVRALDLSKGELRSMVMGSPSILGYSKENLSRKLSFFVNTLGYIDNNYVEGMERVRKLLVGTPKLLLAAVDTGLMPRFQFLRNEIEFSLEELQLLYEKNPRLLLYSLDENMREKIVFFLILQLHIEPEQVRKLMLSFPQVMDYNLPNHLKPIAEYYMADLGFSASELGSIVTRFPRLFSYSLFKIKHVTGFLRFELGLDANQVKRVIFQSPQIVGLDTEGNLKQKLDLLQTRLSLTGHELGLVLSKMPTLMNLGIDNNLLPKLQYLEQVVNDVIDSDDVKSMVLKQPTLLGYSLKKRIRPRMEKIVSAGLSADKVTVGISMSENKFLEWLASSKLRRKRQVDVHKNSKGVQEASKRSKITCLQELLDLNHTEVRTLLAAMPGLEYTQANNIFQRKINYFHTELQNSTNATKAILLRRPFLLNHSIKKGWEPRMQKIRDAGIDDPQTTTTLFKMSNKEFQVWTQSNEFAETIDFLKTSSMHFSQDELDLFVKKVGSMSVSDANLIASLKFLLDLSGDNLEGVKTIVLDKPQYFSSFKALRDRMSLREALLQDVKQFWVFDKISTLIMSEEEFGHQFLLSNARILLHQKLNFTEKELDFIVSQQASKNFPTDLATNLNYLVSLDLGIGIDIAILIRPKLLSHTIEELRSASRIQMKRNCKAKLLYQEETKDMLVAFGFTKSDAKNICIRSKLLGMRHPEMILKPKLDLLLSSWKKEDIIARALANPLLFDKSLTEISKTFLDAEDINKVEQLKAELNLTDVEYEHIFSMRELGNQRKSTYQYISTQFKSVEDLKRVLLSDPNILSLSLTKRIKPRMELLSNLGCNPADIIFISSLSKKKAEEFCLKRYFRRELELSQKQVDLLLDKALTDRRSRNSLHQKVEYLLPNAFHGSRKKMKHTLLKDPSILKQSIDQTLKPRVEVLQLLESLGFNVTDYDPFLSMCNTEFTNKLLPQRKSWRVWSPRSKIKVKKDHLPTQSNVHAAAVREMMPSLTISFSDDDNRDLASVVQWR